MRLKGWQIKLYSVASVLYVLEYIFLLLTTPSQDYDYKVLDLVYFQWQCTVYLLLFISIFHSFRHQSKPDRTFVFSALTISIIRFISQGLEGFGLIKSGDIKIIALKFCLLVISILIYIFQSKIVLWYRKLRS